MSIRSQMTRQFASDFSNVVDSGAQALAAYSNSQYSRLKTQMTMDYNAFIDELSYSNDFENYGAEVEKFWANEEAKLRDGGYGIIATSRFLDNDLNVYKEQMRNSAKEMVIDGQWRQTKVNYDLRCRDIISDDVNYPTYDDKMKAIRAEYEGDNLSAFPLKLGTVSRPEDYEQTIKSASLQQAFNERNVGAYADKYFQEGMSLDSIFDEMKASSGISNWSLDDEDTAKAYIQKSLKAIGAEKQQVAVNAQNEITSKYTAMYMRGEPYKAQNIIDDATAMGALREDGQIDRFWTAFLTPYIEYANAEQEIEKANAATKEKMEELGVKSDDDALGILASVADGTFDYKPDENEVKVKGVSTKIPMGSSSSATASVKTGTGENAQEKDGISIKIGQKWNLDKTVKISDDGHVLLGDNDTGLTTHTSNTGDVFAITDEPVAGLESYLFSDNRAEGGRVQYRFPKSEEAYTVKEGEGGHYSDAVLDEIKERSVHDEVTQGTGFEGALGDDFDITTSRLYGKHTYKCDGMPDINSLYEPGVVALCQAWGVDYNDKSPETYAVAQIVQDLADKGAFSNKNKSLAVQHLATMRLNPNVTPEEYNAQVMQYKATGVLTDEEIDDYNLKKHAFADDVTDTKIKDNLSFAIQKAFYNLYSTDYSTKAYDNLSTEQKNEWFITKSKLEQELKRAIQLNPVEAQNNPTKIVDEVVEKLTDKTFSDTLYKALTSRNPNVTAFDVRNFEGPSGWDIANYLDIFNIFGTNSYIFGFATGRRLDETASGKEILQDYYSSMFSDKPSPYAKMLDEKMVSFYNTALTTPNSGYYTTPSEAEKQIDELSKYAFEKSYSDLDDFDQKRSVLFSYLVARSQMELKKSACNTFGYSLDEAYGNVVVAPSGTYGGGAAVVTKDGRVYMSGGDPDNSGHHWMVGSVSGKTLENIREAEKLGKAMTVAFEEISQDGFCTFSDGNLTYTKDGVVLNRKNRKDKEFELAGVYDKIQPGRYNIVRIN